MYSSRCIVLFVFFYSYCAFVNSQNLGLNGTWVVRNSSDIQEIGACPFILIKTKPQPNNITIEYKSLKQNIIFNATQIKPSTYKLFDSNEPIGDLTILKQNPSFYVIMNFNITQDPPLYIIATKHYNTTKVIDNEILAFWGSMKNNVTLNSTRQGTPECRKFLGVYDKEASATEVDSEIPISTKLPPMYPSTQKPTMTQKPSVTKKPNASNHHAPNIIFISSVICLILMK